jgi:hypothetical protein
MFDGLATAIRIWMIEDFVILQLLVYGLILLRFDLPSHRCISFLESFVNSLNWRVSVQVAKMTELSRCFDKLKPIAIC